MRQALKAAVTYYWDDSNTNEVIVTDGQLKKLRDVDNSVNRKSTAYCSDNTVFVESYSDFTDGEKIVGFYSVISSLSLNTQRQLVFAMEGVVNIYETSESIIENETCTLF